MTPETATTHAANPLRIPDSVLAEAELVLHQRVALLEERDDLLAAIERLEAADQRSGQRTAARAVAAPMGHDTATVVQLADRIDRLEAEIDTLRRAGGAQ